MVAPITFTLPPGREATAPPEYRGVPRDGVRLLVARPGAVTHRQFHDLPELLEPGDLLVVNTSATRPAALDAVRADGRTVPVHVSTVIDDGHWVVEVRRGDGCGPDQTVTAGEPLILPGDRRLELIEPYRVTSQPPPPASRAEPVGGAESLARLRRLWRASVEPAVDADHYLTEHGRPISYRYLNGRFPLRDYQTVYATTTGSAEMPSAGRPFTDRLLVRLMAGGVTIAPVVLHTGVSSPEVSEPPLPEWFEVPAATARLVASTRAAGRRVIAVGTTVVRAVETVSASDGSIRTGQGWTNLVLGPHRPARVVNGLISGLHDPGASHLLLLTAVAGQALLSSAYAAAIEHEYYWHEFGESTLLLP